MTPYTEPNTSTITLADLDATAALAQALAEQLRTGDLLILTGELGAGKTAFTQALGASLGITEPITSPTFVIARHHRNRWPDRPALVHVDAYRLNSADELASLDLETSQPGSVTVVEWGRGMAEALADDHTGWLDVELFRDTGADHPEAGADTEELVTDFSDDDLTEPRTCVIRAYGPRYDELDLSDFVD